MNIAAIFCKFSPYHFERISVINNFKTVEAKIEASNQSLPLNVINEFNAFIDCGIFSKGFLHLVCADCKFEKLVAFSCKKRGFCPSCGGRRMAESAAHLVDNIFPEVNIRQWVISFPFNLRYLFSYHQKALSLTLKIIIRAINRYYLDSSKKFKNGKTGAVTLIQRFGSSLNLNPHFHILFPDGVFLENGEFIKVEAPKQEDIEAIVQKIKIRVFRSLEKKGLIKGYQLRVENDTLFGNNPLIAEAKSASITGKIGWGEERGLSVKKVGHFRESKWSPKNGGLCAYADGFSLHAKVMISGTDRRGLEHLCRYITRPSVANERLSVDSQGNVLYELKRPYDDGTTHVKFTPTQFIEKLIALVPAARVNLFRYHGVFGSNAKLRSMVVTKKKKEGEGVTKDKKNNQNRIEWAKLLKRVFQVDITKCQCGGNLKVIAAIIKSEAIKKILTHLEMPYKVPQFMPARASPQSGQLELDFA